MIELDLTAKNSENYPVEFDKQLEKFRRMKEQLAEILGRAEATQEEFDRYINSLSDHEVCKYMTGIKDVISLCNYPTFYCKYRGKDRYGFSGSQKFECHREWIVKLRKLL